MGNLNPETTEKELRQNFDRFGTILSVDRRVEGDFMLIEYELAESANKAITEMDKIVIDDYPLRVMHAWMQYKKQTYGSTINQLVEKGIIKNNASPEDKCYKCGDKGHHSVLCPNPYKRRRRYEVEKVQCFNCKEYGHYKNKC